MNKRILHIDRDSAWTSELEKAGFEVYPVRDFSDVFSFDPVEDPFDAVVLEACDLLHAEFERLAELRQKFRDVPVVALSRQYHFDRACALYRQGAVSCLKKSAHADALCRIGVIAAGKRDFLWYGGSSASSEIRKTILKLAQSHFPVLINGETGVGKELIARDLHRFSPHSRKPSTTFNCAAISHELAESELFGHVKGAFSGAITNRLGKFGAAEGSTLFLDEIGELSLTMQAKLLRATMDPGYITPVGTEAERPINVRILAATNRNLEANYKAGSFREDLFYRLNRCSIHVPPLRERLDDLDELLPKLVVEFARKCNVESPLQLAPSAFDRLKDCPWNGNVRELEGAIIKAIEQRKQDTLYFTNLERRRPTRSAPVERSDPLPAIEDWDFNQWSADRQAARPYFLRGLIEADGKALTAVNKLQVNSSGTIRQDLSEWATDEILRGLCRTNANVEILAQIWDVKFSALFKTIRHSNRVLERIADLEKNAQQRSDFARDCAVDDVILEQVFDRVRDLHHAK